MNDKQQPVTTSCKAITKEGTPCAANPIRGSAYCFAHDPAMAAKRAQARSRGGKARAGRAIRHIIEDTDQPDPVLTDHADMLGALEYALSVAFSLEPSHRQVSAIVSVVTAAMKLHEISELAARLEALETIVHAAQVETVRKNGYGIN